MWYWCKGETSWWISLLFLNFIFHLILITHNSITNFYPAFSNSYQLPSWLRTRFFKNTSKEIVQRQEKSLCDLERARPKDVFPITQEKNGDWVQKNWKIMIFDVLVPEMKDLLFVRLQYNTQMWRNVRQCA